MNKQIVKLITIQELPLIPQDWDYKKSIFYIKPKIGNWGNETTKIARELYIANQILSSSGRKTDLVPNGMRLPTFEEYCEEIEIPKRTAYRWIAMIFGHQKLPSASGIIIPPGKYQTLVVDPPWPMQKILRDVRPNQVDMPYPTMSSLCVPVC